MLDWYDSMLRKRQTWVVGMATAALLAFITSLPQLYLCYVRGPEWNGSCAYLDTDEFAYAAYTNALIDGRPRRNDPFTGKDDSQSETLFSIQFLPAYALALPAKTFRVSASTAFIVLVPLASIAAVLMLLWFFLELTGNVALAGVGTVGVLCLGTIALLSPLQILTGLQEHAFFFPFLRRYIPALPFPVFLASSLFLWRALTRNSAWAVLAGLGFAILVYSYFFLWTATAAWFCTVVILWLIGKPEDRNRVWRVFGILLAIGGTALVPYLWLLMHRPNTMDRSQLLEVTHAPDLFRAPELYGALVVWLLAYLLRRRKLAWRNPKVLFTASFAIAPFLIFNQQVLTGHSLQPFHYEEFITNYWVVIAGFLALSMAWRDVLRRVLIYLAVGGLFVGLMLGIWAARMTISMNIQLDEARGVALRLRQEKREGTVLASDLLLANAVVTTSRNPVLWARHLYTFSNVDLVVQKRRFYQYLYYLGVDEARLAQDLQTDFTARWEVFGAQRANPVLAMSSNQVTQEEINDAAREYAKFVKSFDSSLAGNPLLSYAVVKAGADLSNLDRWYERSLVDRRGDFLIYYLKLKVPRY
jgi:hypothetical protein